jgi:cation diffusion facilitator family transporter
MTTPAASSPSLDEAAALTRQVTRLSVGIAALLTGLKAAAWLASGSVAMLGSLVDSGLDVAASLATFIAIRYAAAPPDSEHRYGHGKAEAFASLLQAGLVFASAALVGEEAVQRLLHPAPIANSGWSIAVMILSVALTGLLVWRQSQVLKTARSVAVAGDRAHYAVDVASNLIALVGIAVSEAIRNPAADALAGLAVVAWLVWGAIGVFRAASVELMDHELIGDSRTRIIALMTQDPRIKGVHQLRTRASGPYVHIQMHADLDPALSLVEAHKVMVAAEKRLLDAYPAADVLIHPDPRGQAEPHGGAFAESHYPPRPEAAAPARSASG